MKKRFASMLIALIVSIMGILPVVPIKTALAIEVLWLDDGGYIYYEVENDEAVFGGYYNSNKTVDEYEIPTEIDGYTVTSIKIIDSYEFAVKKLIIPDTVKTIKNNGFSYCTSLEEVEMGANVEVIENIAFGDCMALKKITLSPKLKTIGNNAFANCTALKEIVIPNSVTSIGRFAFNQCASLEKVTIGSGLKELPLAAFDSCTSLHTVSMGQNIEIIGEQAFMNCTALKNINIPSKVTAINKSAFEYCEALEEVIMPNSLLTVGEWAFYYCTGLKKVTLGNNVKTIERSAFRGCSSLESIVVPDSVEFMGNCAFEFCSSLKSAVLSKKITSIDSSTFANCSSLETIQIPDSVQTIGETAFENCSALKSVTMGKSLKTIEKNAFSNCSALESVDIKYGVQKIGYAAFSRTTSLGEFIIPDSVTTLGEYAFSDSGIKNIKLGKGLYAIEPHTFNYCDSLRSVNIPDNVEYIGEYAFYNNNSLEKVVIGNGVAEIGQSAFYNNQALKSVKIGSGLITIGENAFYGCEALQEVTLPDSVNTIGNAAFSSCSSLTEVKIPANTREIGAYAFCWCSSLANVEMGAMVSEIGEYAFAYCDKLKEIHIPATVTTLGSGVLTGSGVTDLYYGGTEAMWQELTAESYIGINPTIHYGKISANVSSVSTKSGLVHRRRSTVYKNLKGMDDVEDEYVICADAVITFDGQTYTADENGIVPMPRTSTVTVSAPGYRTEILEYDDHMNGLGIFLEKETDLPIIKSVKLGKGEIRRSSEKFSKTKSEQFKADIDFNGHEGCTVYIENGKNKWTIGDMSTGGYSGKVNIGQEFNSWNDSYIVVEMADGRKISKKLEMGYVPAAKEKVEVSFGDSFSGLGANVIPHFDTMKFDFSLPNFPIDITIEGDKIIGTFGVDVSTWKYSGEKGEWDNEYNAHKTLAELIENSYERMEKEEAEKIEEFNKLLKEIGDAKPKAAKAKFGFDANVSAIGYIEGTIDEEGVFFSDGGVMFVAEGEAGPKGHGILMVGAAPVPYNWETLFKGKIEAKFQLAQREERSEKLSPQGTIGGSVGLKLGIGPGIEDIHLNFCAEGTFDPLFTYTYNSTDFKLDANLGIFIEAVVGPWKRDVNIAKKTFNLYPKTKASNTDIFSIYDASDFEVIDRAYLENPQKFVANDNVRIFDASTNQAVETVIKTNTFKTSTPEMVSLGSGKRLLVWVDEDTTADALNGRTLMYSYFDGENWSDEQYVEQDGMCDFDPQLKKVGDYTYLVWESSDTVLSEDMSTVTDMYKSMEIKYAVYDEVTNKFINITSLTDNDYADVNPVISDSNGIAVITWVSNSESDIFTANNNNSISYAVVNGNEITETKTAVEGISSVNSHVAIYDGSNVDVIYITDTDGQLETTDDKELFSTYNGQVTDDDIVQSGLQSVGNTVYMYNGGKLATYHSSNITDTGVVLPNDKFVVSAEDRTVAYLDGSEAATDIYAYIYDSNNGCYGKAVRLTDFGVRLEDISGFTNEDGQFEYAFNKRHITGDFEENIKNLFGQSDLSTVVINPSYSLTLDYAFIDVNSMVEGYDSVIEADITNNGEKTITKVNVALLDENGAELVSSDEEITLLPGESDTVELVYTIPEDFTGFDGKVQVKITGTEENDLTDNLYDISLKCRDISLDRLNYVQHEDKSYSIYAEVSNLSFEDESDIKVKLKNGDAIVEEKTVSQIAKLESEIIVFDNVLANTKYDVVVEPLENETMIGNNDEFIMIASEEDDFEYAVDNVRFSIGEETINVTADVIADTATTENATAIIALFNKQGILVSSKIVPVNFDNETIKSINTDITACEFDSAKIMLWNGDNKPLAEVIQ